MHKNIWELNIKQLCHSNRAVLGGSIVRGEATY